MKEIIWDIRHIMLSDQAQLNKTQIDGWEPFAVTGSPDNACIWLRKAIVVEVEDE